MDILQQMNLTSFSLYELIKVKGVHHTIDGYPLMASPVQSSALIAFYMYVVLKWGPSFMKNRKPFNLKPIMSAYNIFQIFACTYLVTNFFKVGFKLSFIGRCAPTVEEHEQGQEAVYYGWLTMCLRMVELIETVFFVLRKKQNQVSALHVYHHTSTVIIVWWTLKLSLSYQEMSTMVLNLLVHIVMYSYYLLSSYKMFQSLTKRVKPLITIMQLAQLVTILVNVCAALQPTCGANKLIYKVQAVNFVILISFFCNFYVQNFTARSRKEKQG